MTQGRTLTIGKITLVILGEGSAAATVKGSWIIGWRTGGTGFEKWNPMSGSIYMTNGSMQQCKLPWAMPLWSWYWTWTISNKQNNHPLNTLALEPAYSIIWWYDLHLKVAEGGDQINLFHQVFTKWYNKVREADPKIILYPWAVSNCIEQPTQLIENPTDIPLTLPILRKFIHKLFLCTTGGDYHIQVIGSKEDLSIIMQTVGWWLKSTLQGMWLMDLQSAKEATCAGWSLFSARDYDREELSHKIWEFTGVQVATRFWAIKDGKKREKNAKLDPSAPNPPPPIKALHMEMDKENQGANCACIENFVLLHGYGLSPWYKNVFCPRLLVVN